jgi:hypothetical protein
LPSGFDGDVLSEQGGCEVQLKGKIVLVTGGGTGIGVFLASDDSNFMTGSTVMVDGGVHFVDSFAAGVSHYGATWG